MDMILQVQALQKSFKKQEVIKGVSFDLQEGEIISILGPSGCGKSTLLQVVAGLQPLDDGEIRIGGQVVSSRKREVPPEKRQVNMVFQDYALWPHMDVFANISYGLRRLKLTTAQIAERVERTMELLRLGGFGHRLPSELSGGQQQRVGIARALVTEPRLLLLDEPLCNLDSKLRMQMRNELSYLIRNLGTASLYVTHDTLEAFAFADRILVMREGRIEQLDTPVRIFEKPASPWVAELMGFHHRLQAEIVGNKGKTVQALVAGQLVEGVMPAEPEKLALSSRPTGAVMLLHTDNLLLADRSESSDGPERSMPELPAMNRLKGRVLHIVYEGNHWRVMVDVGEEQRVQVISKRPVELNEQVEVIFPVDRSLLYTAN